MTLTYDQLNEAAQTSAAEVMRLRALLVCTGDNIEATHKLLVEAGWTFAIGLTAAVVSAIAARAESERP